MEVERICQWCGKPFIAHTMVSRYCSRSCNGKAYKDKQRKEKLQKYGVTCKSVWTDILNRQFFRSIGKETKE